MGGRRPPAAGSQESWAAKSRGRALPVAATGRVKPAVYGRRHYRSRPRAAGMRFGFCHVRSPQQHCGPLLSLVEPQRMLINCAGLGRRSRRHACGGQSRRGCGCGRRTSPAWRRPARLCRCCWPASRPRRGADETVPGSEVPCGTEWSRRGDDQAHVAERVPSTPGPPIEIQSAAPSNWIAYGSGDHARVSCTGATGM